MYNSWWWYHRPIDGCSSCQEIQFLDIVGEGRICECTEPKIEKGVACLYTSLRYNFDNQHSIDSMLYYYDI